MTIFVAGATGAIGVPLIRRLVRQGRSVVGLTRHTAKQGLLRELGAHAVVADALDRDAIDEAVTASKPSVVIHALTAIPKRGPLRPGDLAATNRLRVEGTHNLLDASVAAGARRFVAESMLFVYGFGDHGLATLHENYTPRRSPEAWLREADNALAEEESLVMQAAKAALIEGVVLRLGLLYGVDAGWRQLARLMKWRAFPIPGQGEGIGSWVHIEDVAAAFDRALEHGRSGEAYNIVDDEPVSFRDFATTFARELGAPPPIRLPRSLFRLVAPSRWRTWTA